MWTREKITLKSILFSVAGGSSSLSTFLIGLFGLLAIKFNCKELLTVSQRWKSSWNPYFRRVRLPPLLVSFWPLSTSWLCCAAYVSCAAQQTDAVSAWIGQSQYWVTRFKPINSLILFAIGCTWVLASNAINVYLLYLAWPFCFNESLDDTMNKIESEIDTVTN